MLSGKKVLITGGAGFLGCHVALGFLEREAEVVTYDIADMDGFESDPIQAQVKDRTQHVVGDVRDFKKLEEVMKGVDVVVHAAAALPLTSRDEIFGVNVVGTRVVLEVAHRAGVDRVVHISSTAVYGVPDKHPIEEGDPKVGVGAYGESKIAAEEVCREFRERGLCVCVLRPKTFIGVGRLGVFQILFDWVQKGARIPVIGNGNNRYQLLSVVDLVEAILLASVKEKEKVNDDFNVGAERFGTVREDVGALCAAAGSGSKVLGTPAVIVKGVLRGLERMKLSPLYQWVYDTADKDSYVSIEKIQRELGWQPKKSNAEALTETYAWYNTQYQEYRGGIGKSHKVAWDQGALSLARRLLGGWK